MPCRRLVLCALLLLLPTLSLADGVVVPDADARAATVRQEGDRIRPQGVTPLVSELLRVVEQERVTLARLRASIAESPDAARRLELQRRIESVKRDTQIALLRLQADYARREGRLQAAQELETALHHILNPAVAPASARRQQDQVETVQ